MLGWDGVGWLGWAGLGEQMWSVSNDLRGTKVELANGFWDWSNPWLGVRWADVALTLLLGECAELSESQRLSVNLAECELGDGACKWASWWA